MSVKVSYTSFFYRSFTSSLFMYATTSFVNLIVTQWPEELVDFQETAELLLVSERTASAPSDLPSRSLGELGIRDQVLEDFFCLGQGVSAQIGIMLLLDIREEPEHLLPG